MRLLSRLFLATIMALGIAANSRSAADAPRNVIFDTDMGGDCDDVGALLLLHGAVERGKARLLATIGCTSSEAIAPCLDAINTWFGRAEIPVGTLKDPGFLDGRGFPEEIVRCFPHRSPTSAHYPDALALYRQVLAAQPDGSVIIVAVGPLRNLANLLRSGPDAATPLTGPALIARKVKLLHVMGGHYPPQAKQKDAEYNFQKDPASAALVCTQWPTPVLFNGEGGSTSSGRRVTYEMPEHNPLTMAYAAYPSVGFAGDRLSWDPVSCLVAVRGAAPWYEVVNGSFNLTGCGDSMTGFWERRRDQGAYVNQAIIGDSSLSARLTRLGPNVGGPSYQWDSRPSTASGLMLRESLAEGCGRYALIQIEATGKLVFRWRDKVGPDESKARELGKVALPIHVKLVRKECQVHILTSVDGRNWGEPIVTHTMPFAGQARLGLFTCSGNTFASTTAVFEAVALNPH